MNRFKESSHASRFYSCVSWIDWFGRLHFLQRAVSLQLSPAVPGFGIISSHVCKQSALSQAPCSTLGGPSETWRTISSVPTLLCFHPLLSAFIRQPASGGGGCCFDQTSSAAAMRLQPERGKILMDRMGGGVSGSVAALTGLPGLPSPLLPPDSPSSKASWEGGSVDYWRCAGVCCLGEGRSSGGGGLLGCLLTSGSAFFPPFLLPLQESDPRLLVTHMNFLNLNHHRGNDKIRRGGEIFKHTFARE